VSATTVSIGGQSLGSTQAIAVNQLSGLDCGAGQFLTRQGGTVSCAQSVPAGAVAGFTSACPAGWTALSAAAGRFLVGTGTGPGGNTYTLSSVGGTASITITMPNLPMVWQSGQASSVTATVFPAQGTVVGNTAQAIDTRPPYYAVNWCQKS
jgi:hypothetical protein